ncbi:hypothetical protein AB6D20_006385 [Vibrio splendidus]
MAVELGGSVFSEIIKFWALKYFSKHICPKKFSLSSDEAKKYNFYEVRVIFPTDRDKVLYQFMPEDNGVVRSGLVSGCKFVNPELTENCFVSEHSLKRARFDVIYYFKGWRIDEQHCSEITLIKFVLWRALFLIYPYLTYTKLKNKLNSWRVTKRLRTPLKSKYEIYESLMSNDTFLKTGQFRQSDIVSGLLGGKHIANFDLTRKLSKSLDWILESSIEDGEISRVSHERDHDPLFKMKGKGIHYFTLTKEQIKNEEHNRLIQKAQVKIQQRMLLLTFLLVIATFITTIDKFDDLMEIVEAFKVWFSRFIE